MQGNVVLHHMSRWEAAIGFDIRSKRQQVFTSGKRVPTLRTAAPRPRHP
jgi:hypothetical protein